MFHEAHLMSTLTRDVLAPEILLVIPPRCQSSYIYDIHCIHPAALEDPLLGLLMYRAQAPSCGSNTLTMQ